MMTVEQILELMKSEMKKFKEVDENTLQKADDIYGEYGNYEEYRYLINESNLWNARYHTVRILYDKITKGDRNND